MAAADKAQAYCPRAEGLLPRAFAKPVSSTSYELLNNKLQ
jgi:hypothetical protein